MKIFKLCLPCADNLSLSLSQPVAIVPLRVILKRESTGSSGCLFAARCKRTNASLKQQATWFFSSLGCYSCPKERTTFWGRRRSQSGRTGGQLVQVLRLKTSRTFKRIMFSRSLSLSSVPPFAKGQLPSSLILSAGASL